MWYKYGQPLMLIAVFWGMVETLFAVSVALWMTNTLAVIATGIFFTALWTDMFFDYIDEREQRKALDNQQTT
jgi:hypothetical protein